MPDRHQYLLKISCQELLQDRNILRLILNGLFEVNRATQLGLWYLVTVSTKTENKNFL